jgi:serine protease
MRKAHVMGVVFLSVAVVSSLPSIHGQGKQKSYGELVSETLEAHHDRQFVVGEIIVKRKVGAPRFNTAQVGALDVEPVPQVIYEGELVYRIRRTAMATLSRQAQNDRTLKAVAAFRAMPDVLYAQPNYIYYPVETDPNDVRYPEQWHYFKNGTGAGESPGGIGLPLVWDAAKGSASVVVAVLDTGILPNHPDIIGSPNQIGGYDMISDPVRANDGDGRDPDPTDTGDGVSAGECGGTPETDRGSTSTGPTSPAQLA